MDLLKSRINHIKILIKIPLLVSGLLFLSSCAKVHYLTEQGIGQISLLTRAKENDVVLKDVRVAKKDKEKIKKIEIYKKYFYKYWEKKPTSIYSKTTFLESKAVSYLVIASPYSEIKAKQECFPIMGCFPYLGFYSKKSAQDHAKDLERNDYVTYIRPVYAYSTLGYFTDTILSSFFYYNEFDLAELIFHELFHTIFFIKDEVQLNENLANYFGREMAMEYFDYSSQKRQELERDNLNQQKMSLLIVELAKELNQIYKDTNFKSKNEAQEFFNKWKRENFDTKVSSFCLKENISEQKCFPKRRKWNNASLAAFLTYEKEAQKIVKLQKKLGLNIKQFYFHIEKLYNKFKDEGEGEFSSYLFKNL